MKAFLNIIHERHCGVVVLVVGDWCRAEPEAKLFVAFLKMEHYYKLSSLPWGKKSQSLLIKKGASTLANHHIPFGTQDVQMKPLSSEYGVKVPCKRERKIS